MAAEQVDLLDRQRLRYGMVTSTYCFLQLPSHADAVRACDLLQGVDLVAGRPLHVGWADASEWNRASPRLPGYF